MATITEILTAIEAPRELIEGLEKGDKKPEDFKNFINTTFISKTMALDDEDIKGKIVGKLIGGITTKLKAVGGLDKKEIEGKKIEDIIDLLGVKHTTALDEIKKQNTGTADEAVKALNTKIEKLQRERDDFKGINETLNTKLAETQTTFDSKIKEFKLTNKLTGIHSKIPFKDGMTEIEKSGFNALLSNNYKFDLDENDNEIVYDKAGNKIKSQSGTKFMTVEELIIQEADKNNLIKKNNAGGQRQTFFTPGTPNGTVSPTSKMAERKLAVIESMKSRQKK